MPSFPHKFTQYSNTLQILSLDATKVLIIAEGCGASRDKNIPVLQSDSVAGLSSARCTNEDNFVFQKFMRAAIGTNNVDHCART